MGAVIQVELWCEDRRQGTAAAAAVMEEMHRIDRALSPQHAASELCRINAEAAQRPVVLTAEMCGLLDRALAYSRLCGGAFDISPAFGWQHLRLDRDARTLRFDRAGMRIELGGFARGHALDRAAALLRRRGIVHAMVSAGGEHCVIGDRRGVPWSVTLRDPRRGPGHEGAALAVLPLEDASISTAGACEPGSDDGDERVPQLIEPAAGLGPQALHSVTVLAADGLAGAALSQAVFGLGLQRGLALIETLAGVDAVAVDANGALHASSGLWRGAGQATRQ